MVADDDRYIILPAKRSACLCSIKCDDDSSGYFACSLALNERQIYAVQEQWLIASTTYQNCPVATRDVFGV